MDYFMNNAKNKQSGHVVVIGGSLLHFTRKMRLRELRSLRSIFKEKTIKKIRGTALK